MGYVDNRCDMSERWWERRNPVIPAPNASGSTGIRCRSELSRSVRRRLHCDAGGDPLQAPRIKLLKGSADHNRKSALPEGDQGTNLAKALHS